MYTVLLIDCNLDTSQTRMRLLLLTMTTVARRGYGTYSWDVTPSLPATIDRRVREPTEFNSFVLSDMLLVSDASWTDYSL